MRAAECRERVWSGGGHRRPVILGVACHPARRAIHRYACLVTAAATALTAASPLAVVRPVRWRLGPLQRFVSSRHTPVATNHHHRLRPSCRTSREHRSRAHDAAGTSHHHHPHALRPASGTSPRSVPTSVWVSDRRPNLGKAFEPKAVEVLRSIVTMGWNEIVNFAVLLRLALSLVCGHAIFCNRPCR